ncbi:MAG TPA: carboxypeptidase-like regulatory domain-containing protein [Vicinamibacterales bacterium]|nr:carboxypeptidase-like regulatory domain-containing protein [Vicinamibacterales bacterium]
MARWSGSIGLVVGAALAASLVASPAAAQVYVPPGGWTPFIMPSLHPSGPAMVLGQVVDAATGRGVPQAVVRLEGRMANVRVADDRGRFYFVGLAGGRYFISATKPGYIDGGYGQRRAGGDGLPLDLVDHQWATDASISLWRAAAIGGAVVDEVGEPLVGVRVEVLRRQYVGTTRQLAPSGSDTTDDQGAYHISNLVPGDYLVEVPSAVISADAGLLDATLAGLMARSTQADLSAPATPPVGLLDSIRRVSDLRDSPDGKQILLPFGAMLPVPPGSTRTHRLAYRTTYHVGTGETLTATVVTVGAGESRGNVDVHVTPVPAVKISGTVVGPDGPIGGRLLRLMAREDEDVGFGHERAVTTSGANGAFVFPEVPSGDYVIDAPNRAQPVASSGAGGQADLSDLADHPAWISLAVAPDVPDTVEDTRSSLWGQTAVMALDLDVSDVRVMLQPGAVVSGHVAFETTHAPPAIENGVLSIDAAMASGRFTRRGVVDNDGMFAIRGLAPGSYFMFPAEPPPGWFIKSVTSQGRDLLSTPLLLAAGEQVPDIVITLTDRPTEIMGTVITAPYFTVANATVLAFPAEPQTSSAARSPLRLRSTRARLDGAYHLVGLPLGDYYLVAIDDASSDGWQDPQRLAALRASAVRVSLTTTDMKQQDLQIVVKR